MRKMAREEEETQWKKESNSGKNKRTLLEKHFKGSNRGIIDFSCAGRLCPLDHTNMIENIGAGI